MTGADDEPCSGPARRWRNYCQVVKQPTPARGRHGLWRAASEFDAARANQLAFGTLELRGASADEVAARDTYLQLLGVGPQQRVLEIGCGSGVVLRDIAQRVGSGGRAVGIDPSAALLAIARDLAARDGLTDRMEFRQADARTLPFDTGGFDATLAVTVLVHIPDGESVVPEMVRVTRPGGAVGVFDRDHDSLILSHPDRALTRRIIAATADEISADSWLPRRLPGLFERAGLQEVVVRGFTSIERSPDGFYGQSFLRFAAVAREIGALSEEDHRSWTAGFDALSTSGMFVAGITHLFVMGRKPHSGLDAGPS